MEITGYVLSIFIGITLGLIGAGGSILTVPVLVYLFHIHPTLATSYSLFIIGLTSLFGTIIKAKQNCVAYAAVFYFGIPSILVVLLVRKIILVHIPESLGNFAGIAISKSAFTMVAFALLMVGSSLTMIFHQKQHAQHSKKIKYQALKMILCGAGIGLVTGFLGAGGGFLIIPALVILLDMPIKKAIGTSLMLITINSIIGFLGDLDHVSIQWTFIFKIIALTCVGFGIGNYLQSKIASEKLKPIFGIFILVVGIYILFRELF